MTRQLRLAVVVGAVVGALSGFVECVLRLVRVPWWPLETSTIPVAMLVYGLVGAAMTALWGLAVGRVGRAIAPARALAFSATAMIALVVGLSLLVEVWLPTLTVRVSLLVASVWTGAWLSVVAALLLRAPRRATPGPSDSAWLRGLVVVSLLLAVMAAISFIPPHLWVSQGRLARSKAQEGANRPNVLLIVMDTTRADHVSSYGYHRRTTPNVDRLAQEGVLFEQAYAPSPWTLPSHASLFTGLYPSQHGTDWPHQRLDGRLLTLAERLHDHGYQTAGFSNNAWIGLAANFHQGFDFFAETWETGGRLIDRLALLGVMRKLANVAIQRAVPDAGFTNQHVRWWVNRVLDPERPFFVFINYIDPHFPYKAPESYRRRFLRRVNHPAEQASSAVAVRRLAPVVAPAPLTHLDPETQEVLSDLYDGEIAYVDAAIGELVDELQARKLLDNTVVIVTADHGENIGDHALFGHQHCVYETLLHVPLILRYPPVFPAGIRIKEAVSLVDVVPTLVRLLDLKAEPASAALPGHSWVGSDLAVAPDRAILAEYTGRADLLAKYKKREQPIEERYFTRDLKSLRDGAFKLIWASDGHHELYDLSVDPEESQNLIGQFPERANALAAKLHEQLAAMKSVGSPEAVRPLDERTHRQLRALGYFQ